MQTLKFVKLKKKFVCYFFLIQMYDYKCDIKLKVAGANFKAHRDVLAEASDYFSAMFSHDMLEREKDVVELHGMSPGGFAVILDYFYHGHVTIDHNNIEDVLEVIFHLLAFTEGFGWSKISFLLGSTETTFGNY